jgi:hypothetical protein
MFNSFPLNHLQDDNLFIILCGDRNWTDFKTIDNFLAVLSKDIEIVHGDCNGADKIGGYLAHKRGLIVHPESADWTKFGIKAGPIRNKLMVKKYPIDYVVVFHNDLLHSKGTIDMIKVALENNIPVLINK